jgi:aminoglycoside/choline kinase family phosphotransferase
MMDETEIRKVVNRMREKKDLPLLEEKTPIISLPGGSEREFYRLPGDGGCVVMCGKTIEDFREYLEIQNFLEKRGVGVPHILSTDENEKVILMEDLGVETLTYCVENSKSDNETEDLYKAVLDHLVLLQMRGSEGIEECKSVYGRNFDFSVMRWESTYFTEEFLESFCGFSSKETAPLDGEFDSLAHSLEKESRFFMHRDFQSQNIIYKNGEVRIIDFQTAHRGLLAYDIAALLRDSYLILPKEMREQLLRYYHSEVKDFVDSYADFRTFREVYSRAAIQRNMQALGAFAFLSGRKKKIWFQRAIPQGLEYLREGLSEVDGLSRLKEIVNSKKVRQCEKLIQS